MSKLIYIVIIFLSTLFAQLYMQKGEFLVADMSAKDGATLDAKIYYKGENSNYNEKDTSYPFENRGKYFFKLYKKDISKIRLDPTSYNGRDLIISELKVIKKSFFKSKIYKFNLNDLKAINQIELKSSSDTLHIHTTGRDPQFELNFAPKFYTSKYNIITKEIFISLLITTLFGFLYKLKSSNLSDTNIAKIILYLLFLGFMVFKVEYYISKVNYGYPPDEAQHFGYIKYVHNHHSIVPNFKEMPLYLSHPPLYYELANLAYDEDASKDENILNFREVSSLFYIISVLIILYIGFSAKLSILGDFVYLSLISSIPMYSYIGASISNDTLAMLGATIFIIGLKRVIDKNYSTLSYILIAIGIFVAFFSKLTAMLLVSFASLYFLLYTFKSKNYIKIKKTDIAIIVIFLIPIIYYQLNIMTTYHSLVPTYNVTHPKEFLTSTFYVSPEHRLHLSLSEWAKRMWHYIHGGWFGIHSHHSFGHDKWIGVIGLAALHIFAVISLFLRCPKDRREFCILGKVVLFSIFTVLLIQFTFSYKAHIHNGYLGGLQPRYVLPFMFGFGIMASVFVERFKKYYWWNIAVILISIQAIYSDFFYFLLYYK